MKHSSVPRFDTCQEVYCAPSLLVGHNTTQNSYSVVRLDQGLHFGRILIFCMKHSSDQELISLKKFTIFLRSLWNTKTQNNYAMVRLDQGCSLHNNQVTGVGLGLKVVNQHFRCSLLCTSKFAIQCKKLNLTSSLLLDLHIHVNL